MRRRSRKFLCNLPATLNKSRRWFLRSSIKGERLYKIARQGIEVERTARKVRIDELRILQCRLPDVEFLMSCSKGPMCVNWLRMLAKF